MLCAATRMCLHAVQFPKSYSQIIILASLCFFFKGDFWCVRSCNREILIFVSPVIFSSLSLVDVEKQVSSFFSSLQLSFSMDD